MIESPGVLVVQDRHGDVWTEARELDFEHGTEVVYRRAKVFVRAEGSPDVKHVRLAFHYPTALALSVGADVLAQDLGRQMALAINSMLKTGKPVEESE